MMNWKARLKSYPMWVALVSVVVSAGVVLGVGTDALDASEKALLAMCNLLQVLGILVNPTTSGVSD